MSQPVTVSVENGIALVTVDLPPNNALGAAVREGLDTAVERIGSDRDIRAAIILCAGRSFVAGADMAEIEPGMPGPLFERIEALEKPVVAAIHGAALGLGLELAMACHYRIATPSAKLGLPDVHLGLIPAAGGARRAPRLIGIEPALDLMIKGKPILADKAQQIGLIDQIAGGDSLQADAIALAAAAVTSGGPPRASESEAKLGEITDRVKAIAAYREKNARAFTGLEAPGAILQAMEKAVTAPREESNAFIASLFERLSTGEQSRALRHVHLAQRETTNIPDIPADTPTIPIESVGVIGAGTMGGGIAMNFLNIGVPVTIVEVKQEALDRGISVIRRNYEVTASKGRMAAGQVEERLALLTGSLAMEDLADKDLIIEAVFESMEVKEQVFTRLEAVARPGAILASNTSFLDINHIATFTTRPEMVVGLHFFSPANVMPLLEVVRGDRTDERVISTAMQLSRRIGKTPVLARVCDGFIANRLMLPYMVQALDLVLTGPTVQQVDAALADYGFAMGVFRMLDLIGLDIIKFEGERTLPGELVARDRYGQKKNGGFYDYDERRRATPSPIAAGIIVDLAADRGVVRNDSIDDGEIIARLLYPVVNEGARILEEGIALRAGDIDVAAILGYNWPAKTGGPMFWADCVGLGNIVTKLREMGMTPAPLLARLAVEGGRFTA